MVIRTLFVTSFPPFPIEHTGGAIRSRLLIDALRRFGPVNILYLNYRGVEHDISILASEEISIGSFTIAASIVVGNHAKGRLARTTDKFRRAFSFAFGNGSAAAGLRLSAEAHVAITGMVERGEVDLIVGRLTRPTIASGMLRTSGVPLIVDADDWEPSRTATQIRVTPQRHVLKQLYLRRLKSGSQNMASDILSNADHVWLAAETDTRAIARPSVTTLPNLPIGKKGNEITAVGPSSLTAVNLFAVGDWSRTQNSDGMNWFLKNVWPAIINFVPAARLRIAGGIQQKLRSAWEGINNVDLLGFVEELQTEYENAAIAIVPIIWGGGTKIKVLEALAYGRVPAGPEHAFEGLLKAEKVHSIAIVQNEAESLATEIIDLILHPEERHRREHASLEYYRASYSVVSFQNHVGDTINTVINQIK